MSDQIEDFETEVTEGGAGIEEGDTVEGVLQGTDLREFEVDGDDVQYYELIIQEGETGFEFTPDYPANVSPATALGRLVQRFGHSLQVGEPLNLGDVFEVGQRVQFEVEEEEADDGDGTFLNAVEESVKPADGDQTPSQANNRNPGDDEDDEDDVRSDVLEYVDENETDEEADVKKALAKKGGDYVKAFKSLKSDGDIEIIDGEVYLDT